MRGLGTGGDTAIGGPVTSSESGAVPDDSAVATAPPGGSGHGGVVTETGIALVHEGEYIYPAAGSEAAIALAESDLHTAINFHLPVIIEVIGDRDDTTMERTIDETLRRLRLAVEAQRQG